MQSARAPARSKRRGRAPDPHRRRGRDRGACARRRHGLAARRPFRAGLRSGEVMTERTWDDSSSRTSTRSTGRHGCPTARPTTRPPRSGRSAHTTRDPSASSATRTVDRHRGGPRRQDLDVWLNRAVPVSEFEKQRPMPDERIVIRYRGQQETAARAGAAPAHLYALTVDRERQLPGVPHPPGTRGGERAGTHDRRVGRARRRLGGVRLRGAATAAGGHPGRRGCRRDRRGRR